MTQTAIEAAEAKPVLMAREIVERVLGIILVAGLAFFLLWHLVHTPRLFVQVTLSGINNGALYALIALGYTLVYGIIELINFSHGDLFMLSALLAAFVIIDWLGQTTPSVVGFAALALALLITMAGGAGLNMAAERVAYRRLRRAPKLAPLITAVGLSFIYQQVGIKRNGSDAKNWDQMLTGGFSVGGIQVSWSLVLVLAVTIPALLGLTYVVQRTRQGMAMRATAQDQDAARLMGINVDKTISFTFALGGAMAGVAGLLWVEAVGTTNYNLGFRLGLYAFTAAVLGGIGRLDGAVLGGVLIGLVEGYNGAFGLHQQWAETVIFMLLIALMVFRPEGILGKRTTEKV
ncbi:MAG TPA: branched-chain amino acid ABC transporter permease [Kineosporiaceae bacterium]|nr:branched-chain amino acid ABC transporter permease [Kineosporiaceae bacterium]